MEAVPQIRAEIRYFMRCCDILFDATPIPLNADEYEVMIAYARRVTQTFTLLR